MVTVLKIVGLNARVGSIPIISAAVITQFGRVIAFQANGSGFKSE